MKSPSRRSNMPPGMTSSWAATTSPASIPTTRAPIRITPRPISLFERIVDEHIDADPDDDPRAPYVGKALTALAGYVRRGLPEIGLKPDPERAVFYLKNASTTFNDEDAQYELAKLQLKGEGIETNVPLGRHWLSILSQNGHAGAQAFFADLLWRGKHVEQDPARALALISIAVENAPPQERLWIEDIYQNIYCGSGEGIRKQATGLVAQWGDRYGRKPSDSARSLRLRCACCRSDPHLQERRGGASDPGPAQRGRLRYLDGPEPRLLRRRSRCRAGRKCADLRMAPRRARATWAVRRGCAKWILLFRLPPVKPACADSGRIAQLRSSSAQTGT